MITAMATTDPGTWPRLLLTHYDIDVLLVLMTPTCGGGDDGVPLMRGDWWVTVVCGDWRLMID